MCLPCLFALWSIEKAITLVWSVGEIAHDVCIGKGVCTSLCVLCLSVCVCKFTFIGYKITSSAAFQNLHKCCWYFISKSTSPFFFLYMLNTICDLMPYYDPISIRYDTPRPNSDSFKVSLTLAQRSRVHFLFYTHTHTETDTLAHLHMAIKNNELLLMGNMLITNCG